MKSIRVALFIITLMFWSVLTQAGNKAGFKGYDWGTSLKAIKSVRAISDIPSDSKWLKYIRGTDQDEMSIQEFLGVEKIFFEKDMLLDHKCLAVYGFINDRLAVGAYMRLYESVVEENKDIVDSYENNINVVESNNTYVEIRKVLSHLYGEAKSFGNKGWEKNGRMWYTKKTMILIYRFENTFLSYLPKYCEYWRGILIHHSLAWTVVYRDRSQLKSIRAIRKKATKRVEGIKTQRIKKAKKAAEEARRKEEDKL